MITYILLIIFYPVGVWLCGLFLVKGIELIWGSKSDEDDKKFLVGVSWFWPVTFPIAITVFLITLISRWIKSWL